MTPEGSYRRLEWGGLEDKMEGRRFEDAVGGDFRTERSETVTVRTLLICRLQERSEINAFKLKYIKHDVDIKIIGTVLVLHSKITWQNSLKQ